MTLTKMTGHNHSTTIAPIDKRNQFSWCAACQNWYLPVGPQHIVIRTDKHTQAVTRMTIVDAILELATLFPASIYDSKQEIAMDLGLKGHIETLGYLYELTAA